MKDVFVKKNIPILLILVFAFLLRVYQLPDLFYYSHDNDLAGWFVKDVLVDHHLRLIGQETSTRGIFIGPLFYYLQIPFYVLTGLDPIGATLLVALLSTFAVWSVYYVFSRIWNQQVGIVGALLYTFSFYTILVDREVVPTMPAILWSVWFLYGIWLLFTKNQKHGWPILGVLVGLIWHINFALVLVLPLIALAYILGNKSYKFIFNVDIRPVLSGVLLCLLLSLPLIGFEIRHNYQQANALITSLTTDQQDVIEGKDKWIRTFHLASKNVASLLWGTNFTIRAEYVHISILCLFIFLVIIQKIDKRLALIMGVWILLYLTFFSLYSKILSEYYLNGSMIIYIAVISIGIASLLEVKNNKILRFSGLLLLILFTIINLHRLYTIPINKSGYLQRKAIIAEIKSDSTKNGYPCVSISFITDPGLNLGYRYFMWLLKLKTKPVSEDVPVYTVLYPLKPIFKEDITFGSIGLIYPDYTRYNSDEVSNACLGDDNTVTEPMFGFTK